MGVSVLACCLVLCWVLEVHGSIIPLEFTGENKLVQDPQSDTNKHKGQLDIAACQQYIYHGQCQFYACLDDMFHCPGSKHKQILMHKFCNRAKHHSDLFSPEGLSWARDTNRCVMKRLVSSYAQDWRAGTGGWCGRVDTLAREAFIHCSSLHGVCTALSQDKAALSKVFTGMAWMTLVEAARNCPPVEVNEFIFWNLDLMQLQ